MTAKKNLLIEIGTEELPPKMLKTLAENFATGIQNKLNEAQLTFSNIKSFATPRRLAVLISELNPQQPDRKIERRGPAVSAAFDKEKNPTKALEGFARSCSIEISQLEKIETEQGTWFVHRHLEKGKPLHELLPSIIEEALNKLPIPKPMRWSDRDILFARPIQWITLLLGDEEIKVKILGFESSRMTYGHRFHHPEAISLSNANEYENTLKNKGRVVADFAERKKIIRDEINKAAEKNKSHAEIDEELLNEVTGLVEWPVALLAKFDAEFLSIPPEALTSAMQHHQKSFPLTDNNKKLISQFITISNIESSDPQEVIRGNERVMRARLSDAKFFYETDHKQKLEDRLENLKQVVFQTKLGNLFEKSERIAVMAKYISEKSNKEIGSRAGLLCKTDLVTTMVGEFPELQGVMGYYYALNDGENTEVAIAIRDHYRPRFAKDELPQTLAACAVAIADRIDTLVGIFGINQSPTGDKDPFGLRRAAMGVLRILIERQLNLNLYELLEFSKAQYQIPLPNTELTSQLHGFILDRLRAWYLDQDISADILAAVLATQQTISVPLDIHHRVLAVKKFQQLPEAFSLAAANKRVNNLLIKSEQLESFAKIDPFQLLDKNLLKHKAEQALYEEIVLKIDRTKEFNQTKNYTALLTELASLRSSVDTFFDNVLVMDENEKLRNNRLALLAALRNLFLQVADISLLQG